MITINYKHLQIKPGDKVLDMGCGSGRHVSRACADYDAFVVGADLDFEDLKSARTNIKAHESYGGKLRGRWAISRADITALPFSDSSFDHVICSEVMEHIPDDRQAAEELIRVLKTGGTLTISVPRYFPEKICWSLSENYYNCNGGHVRIYRKRQITSLFERYGLKKRCEHYAHSIHSPYWWLRCLVGPEKEESPAVSLYRRFLTWDIMEKPRLSRWIDRALNPFIGKSLVVYFRK